MTQVTETIIRPDGTPAAGLKVRFTLAGAIRAFASDDDETVLPVVEIVTDQDGAYTVDLPGNSDLNPAGTRWRRSFGGRDIGTASDEIIVPVSGGPYVVEDILAAPLVPVPSTPESNLIASVATASEHTVEIVNPFATVPIPQTQLPVPPVDGKVELRGLISLRHEDADNANVGVTILPEGGSLGDRVAPVRYANLGPKGIPGTGSAYVVGRLDPGTAGTFELHIICLSPGEVVFPAGSVELSAYRV